MLECYHPSAKISTPYLDCRYLGTHDPDPSSNYNRTGEVDLASLSTLYSRFRPVVTEENRRPRTRYPPPSTLSQIAEAEGDQDATEEIHLDESELFSQLCTVTNIVKLGPRRGLFLNHFNLSDGVIRVWRDWLAAAADGWYAEQRGIDDSGILWADSRKNVGLRFQVKPSGTERMPLLVGSDDDPPVSYTLKYEGRSFDRAAHMLGDLVLIAA
jgi:hypothetical protein